MDQNLPNNEDAINQDGGPGGKDEQDDSDGEGSTVSSYNSDDDHDRDPNDWNCKKCNLAYDDDADQLWISCAICVGNFDTKCIKMAKKTHQMLNKNKNTFWLCEYCHKTYMPDQSRGLEIVKHKYKILGEKITMINKATKQITALQAQLAKTCEVINVQFETSLKSVENNLSVKMDTIKEEMPTEASKKWADIVKASCPPPKETVTLQHVKTAIMEVTAHDKEMEKRSRGIVVYRAKESIRPDAELRKQYDLDLINDLLIQIKCEDIKVLSADRLGRYDQTKDNEGKYRPIKVRFETNHDRDRVLKNLNKLRDAEPTLKALSIRQDLSESQRNELNTKLKEAFERTKNSNDTIYRVRGHPGAYSLKEFPKPKPSITEEIDSQSSSSVNNDPVP